MIKKPEEILHKYKHFLLLLYYPLWIIWFTFLEDRNAHVSLWIKSPLDDFIPFASAFVIPYVLWFFFVGLTLSIMGLKDRQTFLKLCASLFVGMTICNIIFALIPHGQPLRVPLSEGDANIFNRMVYSIYSNDTPTNCAPSIHVLNSMACNFAIQRSPVFERRIILRFGAQILNIAIVLSTMFIKQHSVVDVALGLFLSIILYFVVYGVDWNAVILPFRKRQLARNHNI